jgi:hypothetical protein
MPGSVMVLVSFKHKMAKHFVVDFNKRLLSIYSLIESFLCSPSHDLMRRLQSLQKIALRVSLQADRL